MKKLPHLGGLSFGSEDAFNNFLSLSKEEQIDKVANTLRPKDKREAEKILADGNISSGKNKKAATSDAGHTEGSGQDNNAQPRTTGGEKKGTKKGRE